MSKAGIIGGMFGVLILGLLFYLSIGFSQQTCEVCIEFKGRTKCRTASGADRETAVNAARDNACAFLIGSKTDAFLCSQTPSAKVSCNEP
ncbi:hypothetical protein C2W62_20390 [Candidatus Entotheonella serta]|nr:hypothetical protein C2W62_20390 [Candidatus Entotheonella serta]